MGAQVGTVGEGAPAVVAREGLLAGVRADVSLQQPGPREGLAAQVALAGQGVRADVHLQRAQGGVHLGAVLAAEGLLGQVAFGGSAMELAVLAEAGVGRVGLAAVRALIAGGALAAAAGCRSG